LLCTRKATLDTKKPAPNGPGMHEPNIREGAKTIHVLIHQAGHPKYNHKNQPKDGNTEYLVPVYDLPVIGTNNQ
jgi:hypothetical protein